MTSQFRNMFFLLVAGLFQSCGSGLLSSKEQVRIALEIRQTISGYCRDVKDLGLTAELKYLDSTAEFRWRPPGYSHPIDYDSVVAILKQNASSLKSMVNIYDSLTVDAIDTSHAKYSAVIRSTITSASGQVTRVLLFESGTVVKRMDGWKLLSGQTSFLRR